MSLNYRIRRGHAQRLRVNVFCPTGEGGGVDPSCGSTAGGSGLTSAVASSRVKDGQSAFTYADAPYDKGNLGIGRAAKLALPIEQVPIEKLRTVQRTVSPAKVEYFLKGGASPAVGEPMAPGSKFLNIGPWAVKTPDGTYYLEDGNTRGSALAIQGAQTMPLKVVEIDSSGKWIGRSTQNQIRRVLSPSDLGAYQTTFSASKRRISQAKALVRNARGRRKGSICNIFCPTGEGGGVDASCSPGGTSSAGRSDKQESRKDKVLKDASKIQLTEEQFGGWKIERWDTDAIEEAMTPGEEANMESAIDDAKNSWVDEQVSDFAPEVDRDEIAGKVAEQSVVGFEMDEIIKEHSDEETDTEELLKVAEDWYQDSSSNGTDAVSEMIDLMEEHDAPRELISALHGYRDKVEEKIDEAVSKAEERKTGEYQEEVGNEFDDSVERVSYLHEFYDQHSDEARFSGEQKLDVWGRDSDGDRIFNFETSSGNQYQVLAYDTKQMAETGLGLKAVQFADSEGGFKVTGAGSAHEVFSKVTASLVALTQKENLDGLHFTAAEESRQRLYDRLVKTIATVLPDYAALAVAKEGGVRTYVVAKRALLDANKSKIPESAGKVEMLVNQQAFIYLTPEMQEVWFDGITNTRARSTGGKPAKSHPKRKTPINPLRVDPTRTATLRRLFAAELRRRFKALKEKIVKLVVDEDAFGLKSRLPTGFTSNARTSNALVGGRWQFTTSATKLEEFRKWLEEQTKQGLLGNVDPKNPLKGKGKDLYWQQFIQDGFRKGAGRAFDDYTKSALGKQTVDTLSDFYKGSRDEFMRTSFAQPETVEKLQLLAGRTFTDIKGMTDQMATIMTRTLSDGLVQGSNPREIADNLVEDLGLSYKRAEVISRTEIIRAHAEGQLDALEEMGVEEVGVMVEWSTAADERVCKLCQELEGVVLKIEEAHNMIPRHPQCRCSFIPANVGEPTEDQLRGKFEVEEAIGKSVALESDDPEDSEAALDKTRWLGADKDISKDRPESILNVFCPTGEGGGIDASCSPGSSSGSSNIRSDSYRAIGKKELVDGRTVLAEVPNQDSISAELNDYEILPGIREVPMSEFQGLTGKSYSVSETERISKLADKIATSKTIAPLIVVDDGHPDGPYILEGGHRGEALFKLGAKSFPAMVVRDLEGLAERGLIDNVFCPTGEGGGVDPSCAPDTGGSFGGSSASPAVKLPSEPKFLSSQKEKVSENKKAVKEMRALAKAGKVAELEAHKGTLSPKVQEHKQALLAAIKASQGNKPLPTPAKPATSEAKAVKTQPGGGSKPVGLPTVASVAQAVGRTEAEVHAAVKGGAGPDKAHNAQVRAEVTSHLLTSKTATPDAVLHVLAVHDKAAVSAKVASLTTGNVAAAQKEFVDTPLYDLQVLSGMDVKAGPISGEALCYMGTRRLEMGSTTRSGSYRHELGHAIHSALAGKSWDHENETTKAITLEYKTALSKVKVDPPNGIKLNHEEYETKYGVVGARGLDNDKENFAEHYRLYHREIYRDKNEGGGGKFLAQYRQRHPGMAAIFDAHYSTALLGQE